MEKGQQLLVLPVGLLLYVQSCFGQHSQSLYWYTVQFPVQLSPRWQVHNDISYRTIGLSASAFQYTFRTGIRRFINIRWNIGTGLAFFFSRNSFDKTNHEFGREFRLWQEVVKENKLNKRMSVFNRFRTEERFFTATSVKEKYFALRWRYRIAFVQALSEKWKLQLANEYMLQYSSRDVKFQQNRLGATAMFSVNSTTQVQAGYIWCKLATLTQQFVTATFIKQL